MKDFAPSVSLVIPVRNAAATIDECLAAALALDYPGHRLEIIVVDNGSTDGTLERLRRYGDRIALVEAATRGPAAARNSGVREARNEIVAFTDADCRADPQWLRELVKPLAHPGVGVAGGRILAKDPSNRIQAFAETIHDQQKAITTFNPHYVISMNWASPRELLREFAFDESFSRACSEDNDLSYRLQIAGYSLAYAPKAIVYHSNVSTLTALFRKGVLHGFWSVFAARRHRTFLDGLGHARVHRSAWKRIARSFATALRGPARFPALCTLLFELGKKLGKAFGSLRFGFLYL